MGYFYDKKVLSFIKTEFLPANLQEKTITPQNQTRFITPDVGYSALSKVTLNGILVDTHQSYTSQTDSTVAYQKTTPTGALKYASLDKSGGMSYKINQLVQNGNFESASGWIGYNASITIENNEIKLLASAQYGRATGTQFQLKENHKYLMIFTAKSENGGADFKLNTEGVGYEYNISLTNQYTTYSKIFTSANNYTTRVLLQDNRASDWDTIYVKNVMFFDLTDMGIDTTDLATAKSELLKRGIDVDNDYEPYNTGSIRDSLVTSVNGTTLTSNEAKYGWGINDILYNYRDYINNKGHKVVNKVDLSTPNWQYWGANNCWYCDMATDFGMKSNGAIKSLLQSVNDYVDMPNNSIYVRYNYIYIKTDGTQSTRPSGYLVYELATEEIEDIEPIDNIDVSGGTTTFNNTYHQAVPSEITYLVGATE